MHNFKAEPKVKPKLSIIIPILNEEERLPVLLQDVEACKRKVDFAIECIIVDGDSQDNSVKVCKAHNVRVIQAPRGRGQQLSVGAQNSNGQILLFLHADCRLTAEHCEKAVEVAQNNGIVAGGFKLEFDDSHPILRIAEKINLIRFRISKIFYGDHGIFIRRDNYEAIGGMPPQSLFEDVEFSKKLRKAGRMVMTSPPMVTSSRRFRAGGIVQTYLKMASLHILHWFGVSPEYLSKLYRKDH